MIKHCTKLLPAVLVAFLLVSCASKPATTNVSELPDFLLQARTTADSARTKATEVKAQVAAKVLFDQADAEYNAAKGLETAADYEKSAASYTASSDLFGKAYTEANAKRENALSAKSKADEERKQSEQAIQSAITETAPATGTGEAVK